jgi:hypothetical protein
MIRAVHGQGLTFAPLPAYFKSYYHHSKREALFKPVLCVVVRIVCICRSGPRIASALQAVEDIFLRYGS